MELARMFVRNSAMILPKLRFMGFGKCRRPNSTVTNPEEDPAPLFFNEQIQKILKTLTRPDPKKVFRSRKDGHKMKDPRYKFMTDEELQAALRKAQKKLEGRLQMPPVVKEREPITEVLSKDPALQGFDESKYVFTDITYGVTDANRLIVVRDPDGKLRKADWDERFRMNHIYFPIEGREMFTPKMFQDEHLQEILNRKDYEFILDRACTQFEPDDPEYQRIVRIVYNAVDSEKEYDRLRSTRHYGPLIFHLALTKNIDNLLYENITREFIEDAALLIDLFYRIHRSSKSGLDSTGNHTDVIQKYIETDAASRGKLTSALNAYNELIKTRKTVESGVKKAHGFD
ncbi:28S ribosomal protein S22, mitochondrial [Fopius arisanus]|uniref:28S ribosomal protein S22, mitochondrial n=1 Tax=Fopius arisanus TaxID=64838 RepID=A0A0C9RWS6_9HYME|nr:PREDICTED: 28S ribosomal protein S22, mitochondrial [Fopius arisanus]XP_011307837.1 PREDICTED: 28S ribosomal protein S22, mitochondrial [Fopius arisanus]